MPSRPRTGSPRSFTVATSDGALLRVREYAATSAEGSAGPSVVLAHGWTLTHVSWLPVVQRVRALTGARVIVYDQRGHGESTQGSSSPSVPALGDDLAEVIAVAAPTGPLVLGGHSMGGMAVMAYAGRHPEELAERVVGAVLVSTSVGALRGDRPRAESVLMLAAARAPHLAVGRLATTAGQRRLLFGEDADPEQVRATREQVAATSLRTLGGYYAALGSHDETEALAGLASTPTVVLVGERDRLTPPGHARRLAALIPHAELCVLPRVGHMLVYEAIAEVADHIASLVTSSQAESA